MKGEADAHADHRDRKRKRKAIIVVGRFVYEVQKRLVKKGRKARKDRS